MGVEHYLKNLLYRYNCVIVPGFGAFLAQMRSAVIQEGTNSLYPPTKIISFNEQLSSNDGLLASFMADAENRSYDEMLEELHLISQEWKADLEKGNRLTLPEIGELWSNTEGNIQFQPVNKVNYLTSSFGLSSFVSSPVTREILKEEVVALEENIPFIITPEERKKQSITPYFKYAAVILLAISTGLTAFRYYKENSTTIDQVAQQRAQQQVSKNIQEATFFDAAPMELPVLSLPVFKKHTGIHHIVAGAFRIRENADKKVGQLRRKGYEATYLGPNKFGLHVVSYGSYTDVDIALDSLKNIKQKVSKDAWMLSVK